MSFPTIGTVIDNFNRAALGANWTTGAFFGDNALDICSTMLEGPTFGGGYYSATTYGPDTELYFDCVNVSNWDDDVSLLMRLSGGNTPSGYGFFHSPTAATSTLARIDAGSLTVLGAAFTSTYAVGDKIGMDINGNSMACYKFTAGSWGSAIASRSDSTYTAAGNIGCELSNNGGFHPMFDNMSGGTIASAGGDGLTHGQLHAMTGITF